MTPEQRLRVWRRIEREIDMKLLDRIVEARLEMVALANAATFAIASFGFDVTPEQQAAISGLVNAVLIVGYRLAKGTPAMAEAQRRTG